MQKTQLIVAIFRKTKNLSCLLSSQETSNRVMENKNKYKL